MRMGINPFPALPSYAAMNILSHMSPPVLCAFYWSLAMDQEKKCPKDEFGREFWRERRDLMRAIRKEFDGNLGPEHWRRCMRLAKKGIC